MKFKCKVLFVTDKIRPGGGPSGYLYNLKKGFSQIDKKDFKIDFFSLNDSDERYSSEAQTEGFNFFKKIVKGMTFDLPSVINHYLFLRNNLNKEIITNAIKYDHVIIHGQNCFFLARELKKRGIKYSIMLHGPTPLCEEGMMGVSNIRKQISLFYCWLKYIDSYLLTNSECIFSPSKNAMDGYISFFNEQLSKRKMKYIFSGVAQPTYKKIKKDVRRELCIEKNERFILYAGRYVEHKGFDLYLECAKSFQNERGIRFFCAGDGHLKDKINSEVTNLGWRKDIYDLINACDILMIPNRQTYFDLLPIEAAGLGKVIITTNVGGNKQLCNILPDLYVVEPDVESLSNKLKVLINEFEVKNYQSNENMDAYNNILTDIHMAQRWFDIIEGLK